MSIPATASSTALAPGMREAWERIATLGSCLSNALISNSLVQADDLARERHECIVGFFDTFPVEAETAPLRRALIEDVIAANERLIENSRAHLSNAADMSALMRYSKKAIAAYQEENDSSGA